MFCAFCDLNSVTLNFSCEKKKKKNSTLHERVEIIHVLIDRESRWSINNKKWLGVLRVNYVNVLVCHVSVYHPCGECPHLYQFGLKHPTQDTWWQICYLCSSNPSPRPRLLSPLLPSLEILKCPVQQCCPCPWPRQLPQSWTQSPGAGDWLLSPQLKIDWVKW